MCVCLYLYIFSNDSAVFSKICVKLSVAAGQKLGSAGVIVDTIPLHNPAKLKALGKAWYSGNQLSQPLGGWKHTSQTHTHTQLLQIWFYFSFLCQIRDELVLTINILASNGFCFLPVYYKITMRVLTPDTSVSWFIQIQSMSILETLWVSTSAFLISTPGLCSHQQYWACPSHSTQVGVKMFIFTVRYMYVQHCVAFMTYSTDKKYSPLWKFLYFFTLIKKNNNTVSCQNENSSLQSS